MGHWVVCLYAFLATWATMTSAQINICKLRFLFVCWKYLILPVVVMDEGNSQAKQGLDSALKYLDSESSAAINAKSEVYVEKDRQQKTLQDGRTVLIFSQKCIPIVSVWTVGHNDR